MKKVFALLLAILSLTFSSCGYSESDLIAAKKRGYETGYDVGYKAGYESGYNDGLTALKPVPRPASGTILSGEECDESAIVVTADNDYDYVVSLKTYWNSECVTFYVRAGTTVTIGVPADYLYVYFASGTEWYGYGKGLMFGEDTVFSKDDEMLDFTECGWEYTLQPVYDGNFSETPSNENEFF